MSDLPLSDALVFAFTGVAAKSLSSTSEMESFGAFFLEARGCFLVAGAFFAAGAYFYISSDLDDGQGGAVSMSCSTRRSPWGLLTS